MKRKTRRASTTYQQDDMTRRRNGDTGIGRDATRETQIRRNETSKQRDGETRRPTRRRTRRDENNTSKQRDDRIEKTRRPTGRTDETRDETTSGERAHRQPTKEIKHTGKTSNRHIHRPTPSPPTPHRPQASNNPPPHGRRDEQAEKWIASKGFPHPMSDCRHIATCPTSSSNGVNETRTTRRGNMMRERAEGRDDNGTDSPRRQARREARSRTGRDDAGKELSPTCLLANLLTYQLAHYTYYAFSRQFRPVLIVS